MRITLDIINFLDENIDIILTIIPAMVLLGGIIAYKIIELKYYNIEELKKIRFRIGGHERRHVKIKEVRPKNIITTNKLLEKESQEIIFSDDRTNYIISNEDYKRGLDKERIYKKYFFLSLLQLYGNKCVRCGHQENGIEVDHLFFSKNEGGCFIMKHKNGSLINNAIPLCQSCNRSKSDKKYNHFFNTNEMTIIYQNNIKMTCKINSKIKIDQFGKIINLV